jgi:hypothetical protein
MKLEKEVLALIAAIVATFILVTFIIFQITI